MDLGFEVSSLTSCAEFNFRLELFEAPTDDLICYEALRIEGATALLKAKVFGMKTWLYPAMLVIRNTIP